MLIKSALRGFVPGSNSEPALAPRTVVNGGNGYAAQSSLQIHFGLGQANAVDVLQIRWPSGARQTLRNVKSNQILHITEPSSP